VMIIHLRTVIDSPVRAFGAIPLSGTVGGVATKQGNKRPGLLAIS
jgi:hypothetical protein